MSPQSNSPSARRSRMSASSSARVVAARRSAATARYGEYSEYSTRYGGSEAEAAASSG